jgi:hypothetical protein
LNDENSTREAKQAAQDYLARAGHIFSVLVLAVVVIQHVGCC